VSVTDAARGVIRYGYGPFDSLYAVTDPGRAVTRTTRDAFGRVRRLDEPDRGTTLLVHDGFGELISEADALGRVSEGEAEPCAPEPDDEDEDAEPFDPGERARAINLFLCLAFVLDFVNEKEIRHKERSNLRYITGRFRFELLSLLDAEHRAVLSAWLMSPRLPRRVPFEVRQAEESLRRWE
jgi:YD repeat-containing protein